MLGTILTATEKAIPKTSAASSFARVIVHGAIGSGPRIAVSRGSRPSASHTNRAATADTASDAAMKRNRSGRAFIAVGPGSWIYAARYGVETKNVTKTASDS